MKKIISLAALVVAFTFASCNGAKETTETVDSTAVENTEVAPAPAEETTVTTEETTLETPAEEAPATEAAAETPAN